eukprot:3449968-Rhodomonas_salina.1
MAMATLLKLHFGVPMQSSGGPVSLRVMVARLSLWLKYMAGVTPAIDSATCACSGAVVRLPAAKLPEANAPHPTQQQTAAAAFGFSLAKLFQVSLQCWQWLRQCVQCGAGELLPGCCGSR